MIEPIHFSLILIYVFYSLILVQSITIQWNELIKNDMIHKKPFELQTAENQQYILFSIYFTCSRKCTFLSGALAKIGCMLLFLGLPKILCFSSNKFDRIRHFIDIKRNLPMPN